MLPLQMKGNFKLINGYYKSLVRTLNEKKHIGIVNEWVIDNFPIVIEMKNFVNEFFGVKENRKYFKKHGARITSILSNILDDNQYNVHFESVLKDISKIQRKSEHEPLSYIELSLIKPVIVGLVIGEIARICKEEQQCDPCEQCNESWDDKIERNTITHLKVENMFKLLKQLITFLHQRTVKALSVTEKELNKDKDFELMQEKTKETYRVRISKLSKKNKKTEIEFTRELVAKAQEEKKHVGFYLFKEPKYHVRTFVYLSLISIFSIALTAVGAIWLSPWYVVGFILLLIPSSEIAIRIVNKVLHKIYYPKVLPKMDYYNGIPSNCATMTVIPTVIKDTDKVDRMFGQLEKYFLVNRSENLHFALLGDASEEKSESVPHDDIVSNYGLKKCAELNEKYGAEIFHFAYRKRHFVKSENSYIGYERKRGALLQFNRLVLKTFSPDEIHNDFHCETLSNLQQKIKYVVTLDSESELIVNSMFGLVSTMDHPLNRPVIDEKRGIVTRGYAIMQPKVAIATESAQKSWYVKLFGGSESFDPYNPVIANFYQDVFGTGSFMGKGIYDLAVFDKLLYDRFMDSRILSHDLIESNYLRSAQIADVEIIDDFPSRFLSDMSRHSRWARGDTQALPWIGHNIKNRNGQKEKNPTSAIGKWKVFDNLRRMLLDVSLLAIVFLCLLSGNAWQSLWLVGVAWVYVGAVFTSWRKLGENLARAIINFCLIPFRVYLYMNSFFKSLWRMVVSKKNMLKWRTSEDADKAMRNTLGSYIFSFKFTYLVVATLVTCVALFNPVNIIATGVICAFFMASPIILYSVSRTRREVKENLSANEKEELREIAHRTWKYFEDNLTPENKFLIPDNYQANREYKVDVKTSATNIGLSLTSTICAYKMKFINRDKCMYLLNNIIENIIKLPKWNGHLFNFYTIYDTAPMLPFIVSSVDSGNVVACLITLREFLIQENEQELADTVTDLINETDFKVFYNEELGVFSIAYNKLEGEYSAYNYNKFASESRILSYVAIIKGDVPVKHWFYLDKTLTKHKHRKGLSSWSGSLFEYYMPSIFMKSYPGTIIDESYEFAYYCQRDYINKINWSLPWGISECAFDAFDDCNYKYQVFSVPYLKLSQEKNKRIVISPYSSALVLPRKPKSVLNNLKKLKTLNMFSDYGFYEAYDTETKNPVFAYFAHHQALILASVANYMCDGVIQNYFEANPSVSAYSILNKEIMQKRPTIDLKMQRYKKFSYTKESINNNVRVLYNKMPIPEYAVISNGNFSTLLDDRGRGFSCYNNVQLNRYRKITSHDYGMFMYLRDVNTGKVWSTTYAPTNIEPQSYEVVYAFDKVKYLLVQNDVRATTEVVIAKNAMAELRRVTLRNMSKVDKEIEFTTYLEPTICENPADFTHKTFSNLFMIPSFDPETNSIIMKRNRRNSKTNHYYLHSVFSPNSVDEVNSFEVARKNFTTLPDKLSNLTVTPIDPIMSQRNRVIIPKGESVSIYTVNIFGTARDRIKEIALRFDTPREIEKEFNAVTIANIYNTKTFDLKGGEVALYNAVLDNLYQYPHCKQGEKRHELLQRNYHTQDTLWRFGVSGDLPIMYVNVNGVGTIGIIKNILKVYELLKTRGVVFDVVIVYNSPYVEQIVQQELYSINKAHKFGNPAGKVICISAQNDGIAPKEYDLFECASTIKVKLQDNVTLANVIEAMISGKEAI